MKLHTYYRSLCVRKIILQANMTHVCGNDFTSNLVRASINKNLHIVLGEIEKLRKQSRFRKKASL